MADTNSVLDLEALLTPIGGDNPSGVLLRYTGTYDQIKEARREDDALEQGAWSRDLKVANWSQVIELATEALTKKTKDLQIAAWLTEGVVKYDRNDRWVALRDGLHLLRGLHESFWDSVYPEIDPDDDEGNLAARANVLAAFDGRVAVIIRELPLTAGQKYSYLQFLESKKYDTPESIAAMEAEQQEQSDAAKKVTGDDWRKAIAATSRDFIEDRLALINECWDAYKALDAEMDTKYERQTPGLGEFKKSLDEIRTTVEVLVKEKQKAEPRDDEIAGEEEVIEGSDVSTSGSGGVSKGAIRSRQDALRRLSEIAAFFRQTEPHSPVSYGVERAVKWGNMSLEDFLADVLKDSTALESMREALGFNTGTHSSEE